NDDSAEFFFDENVEDISLFWLTSRRLSAFGLSSHVRYFGGWFLDASHQIILAHRRGTCKMC
ncbi:MAG: hypothetical protein ACRCUY_08920, partial [Thermoguttaceae bacterium]